MLNSMLLTAALLSFALGIAHSVLGERYILTRLFRRGDLPKLFGGTAFTRRTLRFAWHLTTLLFWGLGTILVLLGMEQATPNHIASTIGATFLACALVTLIASRGRHLAWPVLLAIGAIAIDSALS
jgi:hypothetical protein